MGLWAVLNSTPVVIAFYAGVFLLVYLNRRKFEIQAKIMALYRSQFGISWMKRVSERCGGVIRWAARLMIWPAFLLMALISVYLVYTSFAIFAEPEAPGGVSPVLPGVKIPGSAIVLPLWYGFIAIFLVATVHEFSHGIVAAAHKLKISSTGFFLLGPILGAFVEPEEKALRKAPHRVQNAIFAAGPIGNILFALLALCLMLAATGTWTAASRPFARGVSFGEVMEGFPASQAGLPANVTFTHANGERIYFTKDFSGVMDTLKPGGRLVMTSETGSEYTIIAGEHPEKGPEATYVGVSGMGTEFNKMDTLHTIASGFLRWAYDLFLWILVLSSGIGLANLLPLGPADGGRMLQLVLHNWRGKEQGDRLWRQVTVFFLAVLAINIFVPMGRAVVAAVLSLA